MKDIKNRSIQSTKLIMVTSFAFAVVLCIVLILMILSIVQKTKIEQEARYLYENGIEVDGHISDYYISYYKKNCSIYAGKYVLIIEYIDEDGYAYRDEFNDIYCIEDEEYVAREQHIKQLVKDNTTFKMLIADNGSCILAENKESLLVPQVNIFTKIFIVSLAIIFVLWIIGILLRIKKLKSLKK